MLAPYTVMHVQGVATLEKGNCWNKKEAEVVMKVITAVREVLGNEPSIGVITFYAKQRQNISLEVQNKKLSNVAVNTVDGFQGSERDIIIISCVRGGPGGIGFLKDRQRLNVALTRARSALVVVGNMETLEVELDMDCGFHNVCCCREPVRCGRSWWRMPRRGRCFSTREKRRSRMSFLLIERNRI